MPTARILVVDDSPLIREIVSQILSAWGYDVTLAEDGKDGFTKAQEEADQFNLILTDMQMPRMNGEQLLLQLRAAKNETPVILFSSMFGDDPRERSTMEALGFAAVMKKPFDHDELHSVIRNIIGK